MSRAHDRRGYTDAEIAFHRTERRVDQALLHPERRRELMLADGWTLEEIAESEADAEVLRLEVEEVMRTGVIATPGASEPELAEPQHPGGQPLAALPRKRAASASARPFPWDRWMDGRSWEILAEVDFDCGVELMRSRVHGEARRRGLSVATRRTEGGLAFQFFAKPASSERGSSK
jgi:hypothetical protein